MLDEYKTSDSFWAEAINTTCHAINHLYLHKLRHKTAYELLTGKDIPTENAIKKMAIGEVKPQEEDDEDCEIDEPASTPPAANPGVSGESSGDSGFPGNSGEMSRISGPVAGNSQSSQEDEKLIQQEVSDTHPRVCQSVQRDHPVDNIFGSIHRGVTTHSRLANFCEHYSFVSMLEPLRVEEALGDADWVIAMQEKLNNFTRNEVWSLVERPKQNVIGTKWVFCNKQDENGMVTKNKARLVAKGYTQVEGLDFGETYAPMARLEAIRILLAFATHHNFKLHQMDVKSAILNGPISEEVYVEKPPSFEDPQFPNHVYKLHKALCGLKQPPKAWYECLKEFLLKKGFEIGKLILLSSLVNKTMIYLCAKYMPITL
jgi:hypothetical protein